MIFHNCNPFGIFYKIVFQRHTIRIKIPRRDKLQIVPRYPYRCVRIFTLEYVYEYVLEREILTSNFNFSLRVYYTENRYQSELSIEPHPLTFIFFSQP